MDTVIETANYAASQSDRCMTPANELTALMPVVEGLALLGLPTPVSQTSAVRLNWETALRQQKHLLQLTMLQTLW